MTVYAIRPAYVAGIGGTAACVGLPVALIDNDGDLPEPSDIVKVLCNGCLIRSACEDAGKDVPFGIWGGKTSQQRGFPPRTDDVIAMTMMVRPAPAQIESCLSCESGNVIDQSEQYVCLDCTFTWPIGA